MPGTLSPPNRRRMITEEAQHGSLLLFVGFRIRSILPHTKHGYAPWKSQPRRNVSMKLEDL